jgi:hypothetical protein
MELMYVVMRENLHEVLPFIDFAKMLHPYCVQFQPVKHVFDWHTTMGRDGLSTAGSPASPSATNTTI